MHTRGRLGACLVLLALGAAAGRATPGETRTIQGPVPAPAWTGDHFGGTKAVTRPSRDSIMGFSASTTIIEILAQGGQAVRAGDLLMRGDDREEAALLRIQELRAGSEETVARAREQHELAKLEFDKMQDSHDRGGASEQELDRARVAAAISGLDVTIAEQTLEQERIQVDRIRARLERLQLRAPFDGQVDMVIVDVGQSVREGDKAVRVVDVDPLWIDVPADTGETITRGLKPGDQAWVLLDLPEIESGPARMRTGKIIEVSPVADAASATRRVRVEIMNPDGIVAGVTAWVRFDEPEATGSGVASAQVGDRNP
ncbi:MAG: efflux RND transporter periplasmic adaptor subunit [Phycisphaerales bacterium]|nr:efflux RND transporter periplasmic adaptor subunit [Phycisphaerales bacterium]